VALVPLQEQQDANNAHLMGVEEVADWLVEDVQLPQYKQYFTAGRVDGIMLMQLQEQDIIQSFHVTHLPHVHKILVEIEKLRHSNVRESTPLYHYVTFSCNAVQVLENKRAFEQLREFLDLLSSDQFTLIARLKQCFDLVDRLHTGKVAMGEVYTVCKHVQYSLGEEVGHPRHDFDIIPKHVIQHWIDSVMDEHRHTGSADSDIECMSFTEFARGYAEIVATVRRELDTNVARRLDSAANPSIDPSEETLDGKITRLKATGHVTLRRRPSGAGDTSVHSVPVGSTPSAWAPAGRSPAGQQGLAKLSDESDMLGDVQQLTALKVSFEQFAADGGIDQGLLSALEVAQALCELRHSAPRSQVVRYLRKRGHSGHR
jgi:hypothetical protein